MTVSGGTPTSTTDAVSAVTDVYNTRLEGRRRDHRHTETSPSSAAGAQAQGSGFVYDGAGHVVTNEHVVEGGSAISVRFWNGARYKATLVGTDASTDLAVIKVDAPRSILHPLAARQLERRPGRPAGRRDRQPVRPRGDRHLAGSSARCIAR